MNIALIGYRGTGKTTVAKHLAQRLGWDWVDADVELERRAGKSIAAIFADDGERAFRDLEVEVVDDLCRKDDCALALGGGAILREETRKRLKQKTKVIWLTAGPQTIHTRITADLTTAGRRPNLTSTGGLAEIRELLDLRRPIYRECADHEVDTENGTPEQIAQQIVSLLGLDAD